MKSGPADGARILLRAGRAARQAHPDLRPAAEPQRDRPEDRCGDEGGRQPRRARLAHHLADPRGHRAGAERCRGADADRRAGIVG